MAVFCGIVCLTKSSIRLWEEHTASIFSSYMLMSTYKFTWYCEPEDQHQHLHCYENLQPHTKVLTVSVQPSTFLHTLGVT